MFYDVFLSLCKKRGEKPYAVASLVGVKNNSSVASWQRGSIPRQQILESIAEHFGVTIDYLLTGEDKRMLPALRLRKEIKTNPDMKSGERLCFLMDNSNIPLPELAKYAETSENVLLQWINDNAVPVWNVIERVKGYYVISDNDLFSEEELKEIEIKKQPAGSGELSAEETAMLDAFRTLPQQERALVMRLLRSYASATEQDQAAPEGSE